MTKVRCPECETVVEVPLNIDDPFETSVGCFNVDAHDSDGPLVMYPVEEDE